MVEIKIHEGRFSLNCNFTIEDGSVLAVTAIYDNSILDKNGSINKKALLEFELEKALKHLTEINAITYVIGKIREVFKEYNETSLILTINGTNISCGVFMEDGNLSSYRRTQNGVEIIGLPGSAISAKYNIDNFDYAMRLQELARSEINNFPVMKTKSIERKHVNKGA